MLKIKKVFRKNISKTQIPHSFDKVRKLNNIYYINFHLLYVKFEPIFIIFDEEVKTNEILITCGILGSYFAIFSPFGCRWFAFGKFLKL